MDQDPRTHSELGHAKLVLDDNKVTIKTQHMPTAKQLFDFHHAATGRFDNTQLHVTSDGWAFLYIHLNGPAPDRPPKPEIE